MTMKHWTTVGPHSADLLTTDEDIEHDSEALEKTQFSKR